MPTAALKKDETPAVTRTFNTLGLVGTLVEFDRTYGMLMHHLSSELELHQVRDLNATQAVLLWKIARCYETSGGARMNVTQLKDRGYYLGTNPFYNIKALQENGYIELLQEKNDRRTRIINLTDKALRAAEIVQKAFELVESKIDHCLADADRGSISPAVAKLNTTARSVLQGHILAMGT